MGDLNNIIINPFKGNVAEMLQEMIKTLEAGKVYNPMGLEKIQAKIDELQHAVRLISESQGFWSSFENSMNC